MNCERFQEILLDYVDDTLSPAEKFAAQAHLGACSTCRELVRHEWLIGQVLAGHLREAVEPVTLDAHTKRRMAAAIRKQIEKTPESPLNRECGASFLPLLAKRGEGRGEEPQGTGGKLRIFFERIRDELVLRVKGKSKKTSTFATWMLHLAIPAAAACLILISVIWLGRGFIRSRVPSATVSSPSGPAAVEIPVHVSYSTPHYTFHQEGAMVIDALTSESRVTDGALLAKR